MRASMNEQMPPSAPDNRSIVDLLRDLANDVVRLVRDEFELARSETGDKLQRMTGAIASIAGGALLATAGFIMLLQGVVYILSNYMTDWMAAFVVAIVVIVAGAILAFQGKNSLAASSLTPTKTLSNVRKDVNMVKEQVS
jgi:uncharacterized membrane protein YqjE